ncbi:MAG TPA: GMC oxidoreductase [Candidatus Nitrosocosmicus sp.]|nr:GMC oxidoreductase [Candidatus Nitrosocosmicus sp.]
MSFEIRGKLVDPGSSPPKPLSNYTIKVFDQDPFPGALDDDELAKAVTVDDGSFRVKFKSSDFSEVWDPSDPQLYFQIFDLDGNLIHTTSIVTPPYIPFTNPSEANNSEAVVIGSGFGGTITSLSLVNKFVKDAENNPAAPKKKIVILERGQWWVSHELPISPSSHELSEKPTVKKGIREFLESNNLPYNTWPYPDNINGLSQMLDNLHNSNNRRGLLNYRISAKVHTLTASGVGGGSLIYTNVTEEPLDSVIDNWDTNLNIGINYANLTPFFNMARGFLGVNKIVTNSSMGDVKLPRSKAFHDAARKMKNELPAGTITNKATFDSTTASKLEEDIFAADLSITDIPFRKDDFSLFSKKNPLYDQTPPPPPILPPYQNVMNAITGNVQMQEKTALFLRKYFEEQNSCQRQGRCAIGCIPGARHTNNKKLFDYLKDTVKKDHFEVRALADVYDIEPLSGPTNKYKIYYRDYGAKDKKDISFNWNVGSQSFKLEATVYKFITEGREKSIECNTLILAAGAIGSTEILLKSLSTTRNTGQKLKLSTRVGKGYSTNGDLLGVVTPTKDNIHATRGPMVTSAIRFKESPNFVYTIEDTGIPKIFAGLSSLLPRAGIFRELLVSVGSESINNLINIITSNLSGISLDTDSSIVISEKDLDKTLILSGMGTDTSDGEIKLMDGWKNNNNRNMNDWNVVNIDFDLNKLAPIIGKIRTSMQRIAKEIGEKGSSSFSTPLWDPNNISKNITAVVHNLGGCSIGKDRNSGVVNNFGKVYKGDGVSLTDTYDDFYVVDGAIIPTSLGVNPSLTISALAFRIAKEIVQSINLLPVDEVIIGTEKIYFSK